MTSINKQKITLYCFHHAGGSAQPFRRWERFFSKEIHLVCINYPGRVGSAEPALGNFFELIDVLDSKLQSELNSTQRIAFYGHSMGALVAFELARRMQLRSTPIEHLLVSSCLSPSKFFAPLRSTLPDDELIQTVNAMGGVELNKLIQFKNYFLPQIRSDFKIVETYTYSKLLRLHCPITALVGESDIRIPVSSIEDWAQETTGDFKSFIFNGGHFFNFLQTEQVVEILQRRLFKL